MSDRMLRARVAEALTDLLTRASHRALAMRLGIAGTTVDRRGSDIQQWPAGDLLSLAAEDAELRAAVIAWMNGTPALRIAGEALSAASDATSSMCEAGGLIQELAADLNDGRIDRAEARRAIEKIDGVTASLGRLRADCSALLGVPA